MNKIFFFLFLVLSSIFSAFSIKNSFILKEDDQVLAQDGGTSSPLAPCSTFKIALSLMGYDSGILEDETLPVWPFQEGYADFLPIWRQDHIPQLWMRNSCVWYSQELTKKLGMAEFQRYVDQFNYGNRDLSGDKDQSNGLTRAWLSSSLEVSLEEQVLFLQRMLNKDLGVSEKAYEMTKNIMSVDEALPDEWKLYGKTGMGYKLTPDRMAKTDMSFGWFVGWIQKKGRKIVFVNLMENEEGDSKEGFISLKAKADAIERLKRFIEG